MKHLLKFALRLMVLIIGGSVLWVLAYRWVDPPVTYLMLRDWGQGISVHRDWTPLQDMGRHLPQTVMAAEDSRFCAHRGFDIDAIEDAIERNKTGKTLRGGSTISQQTAKNVFLWPGRNMVRKGMEAWFTVLIEILWPKARIMEIYLNVAEMGRGVYGAEAAAGYYFNKSAARLTLEEAARIAAILPQPIKRSAANPGGYTRRYARQLTRRAQIVANDRLDGCLRPA